MKIIEDLRIEVPDTNAYHWDLKSYSEEDTETVLFYGYNVASNRELQDKFAHYKRRIYFNNWAPCEFAQPAVDNDAYFSEIYSICPYTSEWINQAEGGSRYRSIFYPYNKKIIPEPHDKKYDVIYHGGIHGQEHVECVNVIKEFNYRYCTMDHHINLHTQAMLPFATNINLDFQQKVNLVAQSKVSVCYNLVHVNLEHIPNIKSHSNWDENTAFSEVGKGNVMPQFKTRVHEAAISRTLNLVMEDKWNIIEKYYTPDEEFIYFKDAMDLRDKINKARNNWDEYQTIVDNAFEKAKSYQVENFLKTIEDYEM
jgi:hypothetical protein